MLKKKDECQPWPSLLKKKKMSDCSGNSHCSHFTDESTEAQRLNDFTEEIELVVGEAGI